MTLETENPTTPTGDTAPKTEGSTTPPSVTMEQVEALTKSAIAEAIVAQKGETDKVVKEAADQTKALQDRLNAATTALQGGNATNQQRVVVEQFLKDPVGTFSEVIDAAAQKAVETVDEKKAIDDEFDLALNTQRRRHEDNNVPLTDKEWSTIGSYYATMNPNEGTITERFDAAVKQYHDLVENLGLGNFEARVKAAASVPSKSASTPGGSQESTFDEEAEMKKEMEEIVSKHNRAMNIDD